MKKIRITEMLIFVVGAELVGALSALVSGRSFSGFYNALNRPPLSAPGWVFPAAWAVLYALMGISAYLISISESAGRSRAMKLYISQLIVNFLWSPVFFGSGSLAGGIFIIVMLTVLVGAMISAFLRVNRTAAVMNFPYLIWCIYASYLTIGVFILNR